MEKNIVHVIGTGTIGEPLIGLLCDLRGQLGIDEVTFSKHTPHLTDRTKVWNLQKRGAALAVSSDKQADFRELGMEPKLEFVQALERASVVIDCTPEGKGLENKERYYLRYKDRIKGFLAQGSEAGFGKMFAHGINDEALTPQDQFLHIASCNTHNISAIVKAVSLRDGEMCLEEGRFVCMRRASDLSEYKGFTPSPQTSAHHGAYGTHHARDVAELYKTLNYDLNVFSSSIKIPTQYMHTVWFQLKLCRDTDVEEVITLLQGNPRIATTYKDMSSLVFSFGREQGPFGRILNQTVVVLPSLHVHQKREVVGFCFTPQDGNSLLSSIVAATRFIHPTDWEKRVAWFENLLFKEV